ncbi:LTA synthase family protein [Rhizobium halophytocola]|uniref:Phosphoglycerol transferase MdoB-like AlkP superfamily enzyme n=1 Tax=Rhizobium halophytocola TaxID=735519 RepID=A0ABS4DZ54_9HYPH|nr:phosphoglycerol transferase MdoB-like AlkP superfamily enzyme [Rhizobium halophytocola]
MRPLAVEDAVVPQRIWRVAQLLAGSFTLAMLTVFLTEWLSRGSLTDIGDFFLAANRPGLAVCGLVCLVFLLVDGVLGRSHQATLVVMPPLLLLAFMSAQKQNYLPDPLYPSDLLFGRQIGELMPVLVAAHPVQAALTGLGVLGSIVLLVSLWVLSRRHLSKLTVRGRIVRIALALPILIAAVPFLDYTRFYVLRDRLNMIPMMWDQQANYRHNGFLVAFAFNVPMAKVAAPAGYNANAMQAMTPGDTGFGYYPTSRPDIIMVMSESLWDPTRLDGVTFSRDPMPTVRANRSGNIVSPEFGGMTANVEFEALTGFSNAYLPYGSIPYQQYVRRPLPSLATFLRSSGYVAKAFHPFQAWFWNRGTVYPYLGFDSFLSEENLPTMDKRGIFASDESLTKAIIHEADESRDPFFFFAVTLQGHGPYEPNRYARNTIDIESAQLSDSSKAALATYTQGVKESDDSLKKLMDWASSRRRETLIVLFGDHLPPLGTVYTDTGYMPQVVATRRAEPETLKRQHETPLVVWSSRRGVIKDIGAISPSQLPYHIVRLAGLHHPFYTGLLGAVEKRYPIVDRTQLIDPDGVGQMDWQADAAEQDPLLNRYRLLQFDMMFGKTYARDSFFPELRSISNGS